MVKNKPVICQVLHALHVGGAEMLAARLARSLADEFRFVFVCLDELGLLGDELRRTGLPVYVLGRRPGWDWRCVWRLSRICRREGVHVLHAHQYTPFFYTLLARRLYRSAGVVFTEHGRHYPDYRRPMRVVFNRLLVEPRDRLIAVGQAVRRALVAHEGLSAARVRVIYNGIPFPDDADTLDRLHMRRALACPENDCLVLQVARLDYLKDQQTALRAVALARARCPSLRMYLAGEGPEGTTLERTIERLGLRTTVTLLGLRRDVHRLYAASDLFFLSSISEGIPLTVLEAMAAGLPVVATRVGGVPELVEHGTTGLLAAPGDAEGLADHLVRLASDAELRRRLGAAGRARARKLFSEHRMLAGYRQTYREMLGGASSMPPMLAPKVNGVHS
ncbi:MAG: glycosyltransferase [Gemmataceae bacterium]